ncbi:glr-4 [Pristionchus pacificus]|uniref:Glr-4 n=1 Tax=Pristionchus pacificus TaxID=54126 RepID=A0A2A6BZ87_PRIPA|nr:glr-4 [Pristionchus pacificus]|eukprot:PDM71156.1 glr-4 [Pristionchus pacificus]
MSSPSIPLLILLFFFLLPSSLTSTTYRIGTTETEGSNFYEGVKFGVEKWNRENGLYSINLTLVSSKAHSIEDKMCDLIGRGVVGIIISQQNVVQDPLVDTNLATSMCAHFRIPCIAFDPKSTDKETEMVTWIGPSRQTLARASSEFIRALRWGSFLIAYEEESEMEELASLLSVDTTTDDGRPIIKSKRIPVNDSQQMEWFLKEVRNKDKETNLVIHSSNLSVVYSLIANGTPLNMTQPPYSYFLLNTDASILEPFFNNVYGTVQCNISGLQLVQSNPQLKTELALTVEGVFALAKGLWNSLSTDPDGIHPQALLCDSNDKWDDGDKLNEFVRSSEQVNHITGTVRFNRKGYRQEPIYKGIARINNRFNEIGNWSEKRGWRFDSAFTNRWKYNVAPNATSLKGLNLRVVVYIEEPFVMKKSDGKYEGFCIDLLEEMAKDLEFNYTIVEVVDGTYGIEDESGRWNGIIGVLQRHEADLSISAVTITYSRVEVIDFTLPFMHLGISILLAKSTEESSKTSLFTFLEPLSLTVWICLAGAYLSVSFSMWLLARFSPYEWYDMDKVDERDKSILKHKNQFTMLNSLWFAVGSLMQQGSDVIPRAAATRIVAVIWWMFTQILISSYTAQLAAFLTVERMATPIESSADLANQQKIKYGTLKSGSTMDFFRESKIPIYERMWAIMESSSPSVFVNSSKEGIARVKAGNYAYMMESTMLEYYMERDCQLQSIGGLLDSKGYGIALPKGSPLRDIMSRAVLRLQERTILEALKNKWWKDMKGDHHPCSAQVENNPTSSLQSVYGIFYVLATGLIVALLMAIGEYCIESRRGDSFRTQFTLFGQISEWWGSCTGKGGNKKRSKLINIHLDSIANPRIDSTRRGVGSLMMGEELRRLSRLMPFADESLLQSRLRPLDPSRLNPES